MIYKLVLFDDKEQVQETIKFSVVNGFDESYSSSVPQSAVESGFSLADNVVKSNDKFSLSTVVTDSHFRRRGAMLQYSNGRFIRAYESEDPLPEGRPSLTAKARIKTLRENGEIFGILASLDDSDKSQIELIYPCVLTDLSFSNKDGASAVYPVMSIERVRVAVTEFKVIENPTPELIPHIKHDNAGNKSGGSGSIDGAKDISADTDIAKASKEQAGAMKAEVKTPTANDKRVEEINKKIAYNKALIDAEKELRRRMESGQLGFGQGGTFVKTYADTVTGQNK